MIRVVLDTNILVSGILHNGKPKRVLDLALGGKILILASEETLKEFKEVIKRDKFRLSGEEQEDAINVIARLAHMIEVKSKFRVVRDDPEDDKFLEVAYDGKAEYIISGDHHLLDLKELLGIKIITASKALEMLG